MSTILEGLMSYFQENSKEKILDDWAATEKYDTINSPTIDEFLEQSRFYYEIESENWSLDKFLSNNIQNPKYSSDFFLS